MFPLWKLCFEGNMFKVLAALANGEEPNIRSVERTISTGTGDTRPGPVNATGMFQNNNPIFSTINRLNATGLVLAACEGHTAIVKHMLEQPGLNPNCYVFFRSIF